MRCVARHLLIAVFAIGLAGCGEAGCGNRVIEDVPSPNGRQHVVVFVRDCGATTDFSTQVSVLPAGEAVSDGGNVFIVDADRGRAPRAAHGGPAVTTGWVSNDQLEIRYDQRVRVFRQERARGAMRISYREDSVGGALP